MPTVQEILRRKGSEVHTIPESSSVLEAIQAMNAHQVGALVVIGGNEQVIGIFTERDVLRRIVGAQRDPADVNVAEVMTREVVVCMPETEIDEAQWILKDRRIRHLPVIGHGGRLEGLISIGDLNAFYVSDSQVTIHYLSEYIYGRG